MTVTFSPGALVNAEVCGPSEVGKKARLGLSTIDLTVTHSEGHRDVCAVEDRRRSANSQDDIWEDDSDRKPLAG
ncbi:hypothetical protein GN956_G19320 [Arapaima gigas]